MSDFYARLPPVRRFADLADARVYAPVPPDWAVVITDVEGSTAAVAAGRYREVNYVGAASIAAVLNASGRADVPFVFGGDGATLLVPPGLRAAAEGALAALRAHAAERLGLALRVGVVPVADLAAEGHDLLVARMDVSAGYAQALLSGSGVGRAEALVKDPDTAARYASTATPTDAADPYAGLECRWADVPSPHGETVSLLVAAAPGADRDVYPDVLDAIERIYGAGDVPHPIRADALRLRVAPGGSDAEVRLRHPGRQLAGTLALWGQGLLGRGLMALGLKAANTDWAVYPHRLRAATDYRKFDGVLRMVLAGTPAQRARLEAILEAAHAAGRVAYGLHVSDRAVLTCLVYERMGRQVHFVDGAGGGYTAAAVGLKARLKALGA